MSPEWTQPQLDTALGLLTGYEPHELIERTEDLARRANAGEIDGDTWRLVDGLVLAMRVLRKRDHGAAAGRGRRSGFGAVRPHHGVFLRHDVTPRLRFKVDRSLAGAWDIRMLSARNWIQKQAYGYASATAGELRDLFATSMCTAEDMLDSHTLRTLPWPLPHDDQAPAVVFHALHHVSHFLLDLAAGKDPAPKLAQLLDRLTSGRLYPFEDPHEWRD